MKSVVQRLVAKAVRMTVQSWYWGATGHVRRFAEQAPVKAGPISLPKGFTEQQILGFLLTARLEGAPPAEMENYLRHDFRRFLRTLDLVPQGRGRLLEIGANPYFTTLLLRFFREYDLSLSNFFGDQVEDGRQNCSVKNPFTGEREDICFKYDRFNSELDRFPYEDKTFDVVVFCEVIEHLQSDPIHALAEINRVLKPDGLLILSTPNVIRLENVMRMVVGLNIYDPYSYYGPYGRHNREYNRHEINELLEHVGFSALNHFTEDVHAFTEYVPREQIQHLVSQRAGDLGQYIFFLAKKTDDVPAAGVKKTAALYRSYPSDLVVS